MTNDFASHSIVRPTSLGKIQDKIIYHWATTDPVTATCENPAEQSIASSDSTGMGTEPSQGFPHMASLDDDEVLIYTFDRPTSRGTESKPISGSGLGKPIRALFLLPCPPPSPLSGTRFRSNVSTTAIPSYRRFPTNIEIPSVRPRIEQIHHKGLFHP